MSMIQKIKKDLANNWGEHIGIIGLFIMVGLVSYNAGFTNGMIDLCANEGGTLVEHISEEIYCEYNYIEPTEDNGVLIYNKTEEWTWSTT